MFFSCGEDKTISITNEQLEFSNKVFENQIRLSKYQRIVDIEERKRRPNTKEFEFIENFYNNIIKDSVIDNITELQLLNKFIDTIHKTKINYYKDRNYDINLIKSNSLHINYNLSNTLKRNIILTNMVDYLDFENAFYLLSSPTARLTVGIKQSIIIGQDNQHKVLLSNHFVQSNFDKIKKITLKDSLGNNLDFKLIPNFTFAEIQFDSLQKGKHKWNGEIIYKTPSGDLIMSLNNEFEIK